MKLPGVKILKFTSALLLILFIVLQALSPLIVYAANQIWPFTSSSDYTFNTSKVELTSGQVQLKSPVNWFNTAWTKRQPITISGSADGVLINHQVKVTLPYDSDMQTDFDDIRFTSSDGTTLIDYWLESKTDSSTATFWIEVPSIAASPETTTVYSYYGNSAASTSSNGSNTFTYYDDFKGAVVSPATADLFQFHEESANPVVYGAVVADSGYTYPKEPSVIKVNSTYYMAASVWSTYDVPTAANRKVILLKSTDLSNWTYLKVLKNGAHASALFYWNNQFHLFYSDAVNDYIGRMYTDEVENGSWTDVGSIGIAGSDRRDPYIYIENGTTYIFYVYNSQIYSRATTNGDFTGWGAETLVATQPSGVTSLEAPKMVKEGSTYYLYTVAHSVDAPAPSSLQFNGMLFSGSTVNGTYSKVRYVMWKEARNSWHKNAVGNISFVRDGDIVNNPMPFQTDGYYPIFSEGANGTDWGIGFWKGQKLSEYANSWTSVSGYFDVTYNKIWQSNYTTDAHVRSNYQVSGNWIVAVRALTVSGVFAGLEIRNNDTNWYKIGISPSSDQIQFGKLQSGSWTWAGTFNTTINNNQAYDLELHKNGSSIDVYLDGVYQTTFTDDFLSTSGYLALNTFQGISDSDLVLIRQYAASVPSPSIGSESSVYASDDPAIYPNTALAFTSTSAFSETATKNGGEIKYQLSNDSGSTWYWFNSGWTSTVTGYSESNSASEINTNISSFPKGGGQFLFKSYLHSDGTQLVKLDSVDLTYLNDATPPSGGSINYTDGYSTTPSVSLTVSDGTDSESGIDTTTRTVQRRSASFSNNTCGSYSEFATISPTGTYPNFTDSVSSGNCYQYRYVVSDVDDNQATYTNSNTVKVDTGNPSATVTPLHLPPLIPTLKHGRGQ